MTEKRKLLKNRILKELYFEESLSCADLSYRIDKSFPVTQKLIEELLHEKMIQETGYAASTGGRRPLTYAIQKNVLYVVSVAMDQFVTKIAVMDMQNSFVTPVTKIVLPLSNNPAALETLVREIQQVIENSGIPKRKIAGIGIGMPGFVNFVKGINHTHLQLPPGVSLSEMISGRLQLPVFIDNDSSLVGLAELKFGVARNRANAMVINIGWGIGLGMILNGELFRGHDGFAGEFSHIPLFLNGKVCSCGKTGCLQTETSLLLLIERATEAIKSGKATQLNALPEDDPEAAFNSILKAVRAGDRFAIELFSKAGYDIGKGLAVLIHLLNPESIILSGRGSSAGEIWLAPIQQALNEHCIRRLVESTSIEISNAGTEAELTGGAALVMENYELINKRPAGVKIKRRIKSL